MAILTESPVTPPTRTAIPLEDEVIEQVAGPAGYVSLDEDRDFPLGPVVARMEGGSVIYPWQQFALLLIQNSVEDGRSISHRAEARLGTWASCHTSCAMAWPFDSPRVLLI